MKRVSITTAQPMLGMYRTGDVVDFSGKGRWARLAGLLLRPRVMRVVEVSQHRLVIEEQRLTWREWRAALWRAVSR